MNKKEIEEGKIFAFLGVFLSVVGFVVVMLVKKDNQYARFYARQGLVLFIAYVGVAIVGMFFSIIPFLGWLISGSLWILLIVLWITGMIYSLSGEEKDIPVIGEFARKLKV